MKSLNYVCLGMLALNPVASAMDAAEIRKIAAEEHDRSNLLPELKIYPEAREYKLTTKSGKPGEPLQGEREITVTEKTVRGRFIVSQNEGQGGGAPSVMVVTFDKELGVFKKWLLLPSGTLGTYTGIANPDTRSIAWMSDAAAVAGQVGPQVLGLETHSDEKSVWKHTMLQNGKVVMNGEGVAVKTK